ncbi:MAG: LysR family transcriptional regulator [Solirubrobacteraceae bacterium MAG38_C4-C5]|nr:LysR family transcriptional regulator [Candidatus Siliceabacter maunaloa]
MPDARTDADPLTGGELAAFVAAVEAGSVHGAADTLLLTQSAVTKRLQALERRIDGRLLERGRFGVRPTDLGRSVYPAAKGALQALGEVAGVIERSRAGGGMDLRLSASHTIGEYLVPGWLAAFRVHRPEIHPQLEIVNSPGALDAVREQRSDIAFVEGLDPLDGLEAVSVARDDLAVVVSAEHPWARRRAVALGDLRNEPYLTREAASGTRAVTTAVLAEAGVELAPSLQATSLQSVKRALAGGGFTLISRLTVEAEQRDGTLVALPVRGLDLTRELRAVRRRRPAPNGAARAFWRWLHEHID